MYRNEGKHLRQAIQSILSQTYRQFVLYVLDDESTDSSADIVREMAAQDGRIVFYRNSERTGYSESYRRLFQGAEDSCQYFAWISGHDVYDATWLEKSVKALDEDPTTSVVYFLNDRIDEDGNHLRDEGVRFEALQEGAIARLFALLFRGRGFGNIIYGLYRADHLKKCGIYRRLLVADIVQIFEISLWGKIRQLNELLWHRRYDNFNGRDRDEIQKMIRRQRRNMFSTPPRYSFYPWPIVNCLWIWWHQIVKSQASFRHRMAGFIAGIFFFVKYMRPQRLCD